jgi:hypothetical protein
MRFLSAVWRDLLLVTWAVPERWLQRYLPPGLVLDRWAGQACVSLVAFDFLDTRVAGVAWPGHVRFPEVNLRCYVRAGERRGVVFLHEYVPSRWVAWLARVLYGEPYRAVPMTSARPAPGQYVHTLRVGGRAHRIAWTSGGPPRFPPEGGIEDFFKEHEWGFGRLPSGAAVSYRVEHPRWRVYAVQDVQLDVDFGLLYGPPWQQLAARAPLSIIHAEGSAVCVLRHRPVALPGASAVEAGTG